MEVEKWSRIPKIMTFRPSYAEFQDFSSYIKYMESCGAHKAGIAKVVAPKEYVPRKDGYESVKGMVIPAPYKQTMTGKEGVYHLESTPSDFSMTVGEFEKYSELNHPTPPHFDNEDLERKYWKNIIFAEPLYGGDVNGTITDSDLEVWNINNLGSILDLFPEEIEGINTAYLYYGAWKTTFCWHTEDHELYSINFLHYGKPKTWYGIPPEHGKRLERLAQGFFSEKCPDFLRHKETLISPQKLKQYAIPYDKITQEAGEFMITFPFGYHCGFNHGYNCAESTNFAMPRWVEYGKRASNCLCRNYMVRIDMETFVRRFQSEKYDNWLKGQDYGPHPEDLRGRKERCGKGLVRTGRKVIRIETKESGDDDLLETFKGFSEIPSIYDEIEEEDADEEFLKNWDGEKGLIENIWENGDGGIVDPETGLILDKQVTIKKIQDVALKEVLGKDTNEPNEKNAKTKSLLAPEKIPPTATLVLSPTKVTSSKDVHISPENIEAASISSVNKASPLPPTEVTILLASPVPPPSPQKQTVYSSRPILVKKPTIIPSPVQNTKRVRLPSLSLQATLTPKKRPRIPSSKRIITPTTSVIVAPTRKRGSSGSLPPAAKGSRLGRKKILASVEIQTEEECENNSISVHEAAEESVLPGGGVSVIKKNANRAFNKEQVTLGIKITFSDMISDQQRLRNGGQLLNSTSSINATTSCPSNIEIERSQNNQNSIDPVMAIKSTQPLQITEKKIRKKKIQLEEPASNKLQCAICEKIYTTRSILLQHGRDAHGPNGKAKIRCRICKKTCNNMSNFRKHQKIHEK